MSVSVTGDQLAISGEKKPLPKSVKPELVHRSERSAGKFSRTLSLSSAVDSGKVQAAYVDGVLRIVLPKMEAAKPKKIAVKVG